MNKFKPGDFVIVNDDTLPKGFCGKAAKVIGPFDGSYLVEFLESHPMLHNGFPSRPGDLKGKKNHCWWCNPEELSPLTPACTITVDGGRTYCKRADRKKINGTATCSKHDGQDFLTGAIIALARAYDTDPTTAAYRVLKAFNQTSDLRLVLDSTGAPFGTPGDPTPYRDECGTPLCVGDLVSIRLKSEETWRKTPTIVVETPEDGPFIMGLRTRCDPKEGKIADWEVCWDCSWKELKPGQTYSDGDIRVIEAPQVPTAKPKKKRLVFRGGPKDEPLFYGELGTDTNLVDSFGTPLFVGDVVSVLHRNRGFISDDPVVECVVGSPFVMGLAGQRFEKGHCNPDWRIVKARSYTDLLIGEKFSDGWLEVKEEEIAPEKKLVLRWAFGVRKSLGNVGDPTPLIDRDGEKLRIGDLVECFHNGAPLSGIEPIVLFKECGPESNGGYYAMGLGSIDFAAPGEHEGYTIKKVRSYTELAPGEPLSSGVVEVKEVKIDG